MAERKSDATVPKPRIRIFYIRERLKELKSERERLQAELESLKSNVKTAKVARNQKTGTP
jgi:methyltransferase-like protein